MTTPDRSPSVVLAEIAEVRRYVLDVPPHHGGGREALERRLAQLESELARLDAEARRRQPEVEPPPDADAASMR